MVLCCHPEDEALVYEAFSPPPCVQVRPWERAGAGRAPQGPAGLWAATTPALTWLRYHQSVLLAPLGLQQSVLIALLGLQRSVLIALLGHTAISHQPSLDTWFFILKGIC